MNTERRRITVSGLQVEIVRKDIKNLHLGVYPPDGRVRVAAPLTVSDDAVRLAVVGRLGWIRRQRTRFADQPRQSPRDMAGGESHYYLGRRYRLRVTERDGRARVVLRGSWKIELQVPPGTDAVQRQRVLHRWYRDRLREIVSPLLVKWECVLSVRVAAWGIKKMKTKWGSCSVDSGRIWLNLELSKKPPQCIEYILAHEMAHLIERHHNDRFIALLDRHMPRWRIHRAELNAAPLAHENWSY